jgi:hypothetical protein
VFREKIQNVWIVLRYFRDWKTRHSGIDFLGTLGMNDFSLSTGVFPSSSLKKHDSRRNE